MGTAPYIPSELQRYFIGTFDEVLSEAQCFGRLGQELEEKLIGDRVHFWYLCLLNVSSLETLAACKTFCGEQDFHEFFMFESLSVQKLRQAINMLIVTRAKFFHYSNQERSTQSLYALRERICKNFTELLGRHIETWVVEEKDPKYLDTERKIADLLRPTFPRQQPNYYTYPLQRAASGVPAPSAPSTSSAPIILPPPPPLRPSENTQQGIARNTPQPQVELPGSHTAGLRQNRSTIQEDDITQFRKLLVSLSRAAQELNQMALEEEMWLGDTWAWITGFFTDKLLGQSTSSMTTQESPQRIPSRPRPSGMGTNLNEDALEAIRNQVTKLEDILESLAKQVTDKGHLLSDDEISLKERRLELVCFFEERLL